MENTKFINYFEVLNVSEQAEIEVIRSAYRALAKKYHPDTTTLPKAEADKKMALLNEAYDVLADSEKRKRYIDELQHWNTENVQFACNSPETNQEYENNSKINVVDEEPPGISAYIVLAIIILVIIGCGIKFLPELLRVTWDNIVETFREVVATFY